jgi:uncharacterized membrane protein YGL010W
MKTGVEHLTQYAAYHRDKRNIMTHFIGVPLIVFGVVVMLSRAVLAHVDGVAVSVALIVSIIAAIYYVKLDLALGVTLAAFLALCVWIGQMIAPMSIANWLGWGVGSFVVGWAFQFVGHHYEQRKPAFADDLIGLIIGPLFVVAEVAFLLGLRKPLQEKIESVVGPTLIRAPKAAIRS